MENLEELAKARKNEGYSDINAEARVCQDIVCWYENCYCKQSVN